MNGWQSPLVTELQRCKELPAAAKRQRELYGTQVRVAPRFFLLLRPCTLPLLCVLRLSAFGGPQHASTATV